MEQLQDSQERHFNEREIPSERHWGIVVGVGLSGLAFLLRQNAAVAIFVFFVGAGIFLIGIFKPAILRPLNIKWMQLGHVIGTWTNPIVTGFIFVIILSPLAIVLRFFKGHFLKIETSSNAKSYWLERKEKSFSADSLKRQF